MDHTSSREEQQPDRTTTARAGASTAGRGATPGKSNLAQIRYAAILPDAAIEPGGQAAVGEVQLARKPDREASRDESDPTPLDPGSLVDLGGEAWAAQSEALDRPWADRNGGVAPGAAPGRGSVQAIAAAGVTGPATPLPFGDQLQRSFGHHDISTVTAHIGGPAVAANDRLGAVAYASGEDVAFRGPPDLHTAAHEATHVLQQREGVSLKGGLGQAGDSYERQADQVADLVTRGESAEAALDSVAGGGVAIAAV